MRIPKTVLIASALIQLVLPGRAQTGPTAASAASSSAGANAAFTPSAASDILRHSLEEVQQTVGALKLDKWKRGSVRDEAQTNVDAIQRDMQGTLPSLLKEADSAPGSLSKMLPLSRNVDALYDVLVHVVEGSRVAAPGDQVGELQTTLADLEKARVRLGNQLVQTATVQEKQIVDLRTTVQTQAASLKVAATPLPAPKCPAPPAPAKKKRPVAKTTTTKPAAGTPANPPANPPTKPQQ
ncbi:MAG TPA: hypothetical protein VK574_02325 [Terracidiphilus sp.]|jgi:hypothetical protein|nr:hypothetical protein [Terracidiphilus sp.]